jgi:hypothetical protein
MEKEHGDATKKKMTFLRFEKIYSQCGDEIREPTVQQKKLNDL